LQRQIRSWLAENFDFLSLAGGDAASGTPGQLELLSTAIMDGWMSGLGVPQRPSTDALGQLLSDYTKRVYTSQLQHLKVFHILHHGSVKTTFMFLKGKFLLLKSKSKSRASVPSFLVY
jgi:hypothetical protein